MPPINPQSILRDDRRNQGHRGRAAEASRKHGDTGNGVDVPGKILFASGVARLSGPKATESRPLAESPGRKKIGISGRPEL